MKTHGHTTKNRHGSPTYQSWRAMLDRCRQPSHPHYNRYGGRGIQVCDRWHGPEGFANFLRDMGERPNDCSIDRIDNDKNYEPSNCRWAGQKTQHRNKVSNVNLTLNGRTQCLRAWAEELGIGATTLSARKAKGWTDEEILTRSVGRWLEKKATPATKHPPVKCSNCKQDAVPSRQGRCASCAQYLRRTGQERPQENFNTSPRQLRSSL